MVFGFIEDTFSNPVKTITSTFSNPMNLITKSPISMGLDMFGMNPFSSSGSNSLQPRAISRPIQQQAPSIKDLYSISNNPPQQQQVQQQDQSQVQQQVQPQVQQPPVQQQVQQQQNEPKKIIQDSKDSTPLFIALGACGILLLIFLLKK